MGIMAICAVLKHRRMLPQKWPAPFRMAGITVLVYAGLLELSRIGRAMRVMTVRTGHLSFPQRHMRRAHELRLSLQMTLTADLGLPPLVEERSLFSDLGELVTVSGSFHESVTVDAGETAARMRARLPVGLHAALVTTQACRVLGLGRLARVLAKGDESTHTLASPFCHVIAAGTVTALAALFLHRVARTVEKNLPHYGGRKFFEGGRVASFANFTADIGGGTWLRCFFFCR